MDAIVQDLKSGKEWYETDYKRPIYVKGNKTLARDSSFRLLYLLLRTELDDETKSRQKMYEADLFIIFHRAIFKYHARKNIRAAYEERFHVSEKQRADLDKWPALQPGTRAAWWDLDTTTDDSSAHWLDSDDS
jgi:hypothetical protein